MTETERCELLAAVRAFHEARISDAFDLVDKADDLRQVLGTIALGLVASALDEQGETFIEELSETTLPGPQGAEAQRSFELYALTGTTDPIAAAVVAGRQAARNLSQVGFTPEQARETVMNRLSESFSRRLDKGLSAAILSAVAEGVDQELAAMSGGG